MGLHKLTAGDGYTYLTRQVAVVDSTERGRSSLEAYYSANGESPGRWLGAGLAGLGMAEGEPVTEKQMLALYGSGRHPNAAALADVVLAAGGRQRDAEAAGALGQAFKVFDPPAGLREAVAAMYREHNTADGLSSGAPIPAPERDRIKTLVATQLFTERHRRAPLDARELSGFIARESRPPQAAVAGFDLTFSPVKSVSVLWALAPREIATEVEAAHHAAVKDTIGWLEREVAFTRSGTGGVRQVPVRGLVAAAFTHRDSRAGDPDLHTHVAVSNKVQTLPCEGGRWLALDGRVLYKAKVAASERYNTRLEGELTARLGVTFTERAGMSARPVREIVGINPSLARSWSSRRHDIEVQRAHLAADFQHQHGRTPTAIEALALAQTATLQTRQAKHEPRSETEQRQAWRTQAATYLGSERDVDAMAEKALHRFSHGTRPTMSWIQGTAATVVAALEEHRATWQVWHVRAEAERQARAAAVPLRELDSAVDRVVEHTLTRCSIPLGVPDPVAEPVALRRPDGSSVYDVHGARFHTSTRILDAEHRLLRAAHLTAGRRASLLLVGVALAESAANGLTLDDGQAALVRDLATSGHKLQLAIAPAGTGKTTALVVLARAWRDCDGDVIGLAPSAAAARQLGEATGMRTDTLAKLTDCLHNQPGDRWPFWIRAIGPRTLAILDEAGQAGTRDLADAVDFIIGRGGSVRLIGDDQQLAAVGAGGFLRDLRSTVGATTLTDIHRFTDPAEAAATLALRDGDRAAFGYYADHARIHVGDLSTVTDDAYRAWGADHAAGRDALLLAPTRDLVTQLNARARADRLRGTVPSREVQLADGTAACVGDLVVTRNNDRRLPVSTTDWVKNGDRWAVTSASTDGSLVVRHLRHGRSVMLPATYVAEHVQLGYAATVHSAQGMTTDTCHTVATGAESRQLLYVAMSRGRDSNHVYLSTTSDGDPHTIVRPETALPPTAIEMLQPILARDGSQTSATTTRRDLDAPAPQLHQAALRYRDALGLAAEQTLGPQWRTDLDDLAEQFTPGLTDAPAYPTLIGRLALRELDGSDAQHLLLRALGWRKLDTAGDPAAVIDHRLGPATTQGPLPWLPAIPARLLDNEWGDYLEQRAQRVADLADHVRSDPGGALDTPAWATGLPARTDTGLLGDIAVWRAAYAVPDTEPHPTGPPVTGAGADHQHHLDQRLRAGHGQGADRAHDWEQILPAEVRADPRHHQLEDRLDRLARTGAAVPHLVQQALASGPLPTEVTADALWWRITRLHRPEPPEQHAAPRCPSPLPTPTPSRRQEYETSYTPSPGQVRGPAR